MSERDVVALMRRVPGWLEVATGWAARFGNQGPRVLPRAVRRAPLRLCMGVYALYQRGTL